MMQPSHDDLGLVSQDLVVTLIISCIHSKPVLVTSSFHLRLIEAQIEDIGERLTDSFDRNYCIVTCSEELTWPFLLSRICDSSNTLLLLKRVDQLSQKVQLRLGYALLQPSPTVKRFMETSALVFTSENQPEKLHLFLRRQILLKQSVDLIDEDSPLVELPNLKNEFLSERQRDLLHSAISRVTIVPELIRYMQDILVYIRTHRLSLVGMRPQVSEDFELSVRTLCVLQGKTFATPLIIKEAARFVLPLHITLCPAEYEPSLQYGGDLSMVKSWIKEWDGNVLVDSILEEVPIPG